MCVITDHAVLRFLERVKGIDIAAIRKEMRTPAVEALAKLGNGTVKLSSGARAHIVNGAMVTVAPKRVSKCHVGRPSNAYAGED